MQPMRRKDRQKDAAFALDIVKKCEYAALATQNPDGSPYSIPISPAVLNGKIYFHCAPKGTKLDNILAYPKVCLSCVGETRLVPEEYTTEYESAVVFGTAKIVDDEALKKEVLRAICEKYAPDQMHRFEDAVEAYWKRVCICEITIDEITGKAQKLP